MPAVLKYTKAQYEAKISELENLLGQLKDHREKMATLKDQMLDNSMLSTNDMLRFYQGAVDKLGGTDSAVSGLLGDALGILGALGV